jgi:hypothetical protein
LAGGIGTPPWDKFIVFLFYHILKKSANIFLGEGGTGTLSFFEENRPKKLREKATEKVYFTEFQNMYPWRGTERGCGGDRVRDDFLGGKTKGAEG